MTLNMFPFVKIRTILFMSAVGCVILNWKSIPVLNRYHPQIHIWSEDHVLRKIDIRDQKIIICKKSHKE